MLKNHFCFGLNRSEIIRYAIIFKYGSIDSKLTVLIIFAEKYIQSSEYIFNKNILQITLKNLNNKYEGYIYVQKCVRNGRTMRYLI